MKNKRHPYMVGVYAARAMRKKYGKELAQAYAKLLETENPTAFDLGYITEVDLWDEEYEGEWEEYEYDD